MPFCAFLHSFAMEFYFHHPHTMTARPSGRASALQNYQVSIHTGSAQVCRLKKHEPQQQSKSIAVLRPCMT